MNIPGALRVLKEIRDFHRVHQFAPTNRELCALLGINSTNGIADHLTVLEKHLLITRLPFQARTVVLTEAGHAAVEAMP